MVHPAAVRTPELIVRQIVAVGADDTYIISLEELQNVFNGKRIADQRRKELVAPKRALLTVFAFLRMDFEHGSILIKRAAPVEREERANIPSAVLA